MELIKPNPPPLLQEDKLETNVNLEIIEGNIKDRLRYMYDSSNSLHQEYQNLYQSKFRSMIKASLHKLISQEEIEKVLIDY